MKPRIATTVKIENSLYDEFKVLGVRHKITLQGLIERTVYLYVNNEEFRENINNFTPFVTTTFTTTTAAAAAFVTTSVVLTESSSLS